jgi:uncharacterized protein (TIGR03067 family)
MRTLAVLGVSLLAAAPGYPQDNPVKTELARLEGTWKYTKVEAPDKIAETLAESSVVEFRGDKMIHTITLSTGKKEVSEATITIDPGKKPRTIDVTRLDGPYKGKTFQGVYELDGDTLKIHEGYEPGDRPTDFTFKKGTARQLSTLQRVKK